MKKHLYLAAQAARPALYSQRFRTLSFLFSLLLLGITSCNTRECDDIKPNEPGGECEMPPYLNSCNTFATVVEDDCWNSALGHIWFRLDNGEYLQPYGSDVALPQLQNGQRIHLSYGQARTEQHYTFNCNFFAPVINSPVHITCLEIAQPTACNVYATAENVTCGLGVWGSIWLRLPDGSFLQPWESQIQLPGGLVDGQNYKLAYEQITRDSRYDSIVHCMALTPQASAIRLTCIEPASNPTGNK